MFANVSVDSNPRENNAMKANLVIISVFLLSFVSTAAAQEKQQVAKSAPQVEAQVRKLWEDFKKKDKPALSALLDDRFRLFEEGLSTIGDKQTEVNAVDDFELLSYTLSDFTVKSIAPNAALVTYIAQYEGKSGGEVSKGKSIFGEVWIRSGNQWKDFYMQETYVK
jgi:hypothetical protein